MKKVDIEKHGYVQMSSNDFMHKASGTPFKYIKGGAYTMGFSQAEENQAYALSENPRLTFSEMRPVHSVTVPDTLVSVVPLTNNVASLFVDIRYENEYGNFPAFVTYEKADQLVKFFDAEIPSEDEWEYFCRAGSPDLFTFGADVPNDDELQRWLVSDCSNVAALNKNKFGLAALFHGEWCRNFYTRDYDPSTKQTNERVVRGGGACFWPWQDEEWVWCTSAIRYPESDLEEPVSCVRPVIKIVE